MTEPTLDKGDELFEIVDENNIVCGIAPRKECHGNPALVHRTAHVAVFSSSGDVLLQKRSAGKDIQPGRWDTAVGGHLAVGESYIDAARREMAEEIGLDPNIPLQHIFDTRIRNAVESENVRVFMTVHDGPFRRQPKEIDALEFWDTEAIEGALGTDTFTPNLEAEIRQLRECGLL